MQTISMDHATYHGLAQQNDTGHPLFPEEGQKPVKPDPETPYQPTEPDEPDVQPEIIGDN